ncbi:MAG: DUF2341 domain-containing protein [bacterium]
MNATTFATNDVQLLDPVGRHMAVTSIITRDNQTFTVSFNQQTLPGVYHYTVGPDVEDTVGRQMNQNGNGTNGEQSDAFVSKFTLTGTSVGIPYVQSFESVTLDSLAGWSFDRTGGGAITIAPESPLVTGSNCLKIGSLTGGSEKAILALNLAGATNVTLDFTYFRPNYDYNTDVAVSQDGTNWHQVRGLDTGWHHISLDLDAIVRCFGLAYDNNFLIRFAHQSGSYIYDGGAHLRLDDIRVASGTDVFGPQIVSQSPTGSVTGPVTNVIVTFSEQILPDTFSASDVWIRSPIGDAPLDSATPIVDTGDHRTFLLKFPSPQCFGGAYTLQIGPDILDLASNLMDQAGGGIDSSGYSGNFHIIQPVTAASVPFLEDFECGDMSALGSYWSFSTAAPGALRVQPGSPRPTGTNCLELDPGYSTSAYGNETAILTINLADATNVVLDFWYAMTWASAASVAISQNGTNWFTVRELTTGDWRYVRVDLDAAVKQIGIAYDADFLIRFSHGITRQDTSGIRCWFDDIRVFQGCSLLVQSAYGGANPPVGTNYYDADTPMSCLVTNSPVFNGTTQCVCVGWSGSGSVSPTGTGTNTGPFTLSTGSSITWQWQTNYWLDTGVAVSGSVDVASDWQAANSNVTLTATPAPHSHFDYWSGDTNGCSIDSNRIAVAMDRPRSVAAHFAIDRHTLITISAHDGMQVAAPVGFGMEIRFTDYQGSEILTNFPVLVVLSNNVGGSGLNFAAHPFLSTNGWDLRFQDAAGNALNYEIESWNTNGPCYLWVQVPTIPGDGSGAILAKWGDPSYTSQLPCTTDGATWIGGYVGVWHLSDMIDSTPYRNNGTVNSGTTVADGRIGGGRMWDASGDSISVPDSPSISVTGSLTLEAWMNGSSFTGYRNILNKDGNSAYRFRVDSSGTKLWLLLKDSGALETLSASYTFSTGIWYHVATRADLINKKVYFYVNGMQVGTPQTTTKGTISDTAGALLLGAYSESSGETFNGVLDEIRITAGLRSSNWVWAVYMNMASNATFNSYGAVHPVYATGSEAQVCITNSFPYGTEVTCAITNPVVLDGLETQYVCTGWAMTGNNPACCNTTNVSLTLTNDTTLTWSWATNYWLATTNVGPGLVWPASGWQVCGSNVVLIATPQVYYHFGQWMGPGTNFIASGDLNASTVTVIVQSATSITGLFAENLAANGTPEWWLAQYGWTNNFNAAETNDADHDGMLNWQEWIAGTDPTNRSSVLSVTSLFPEGSGFVLHWTSVSNRFYGVDRATNLILPSFDVIATNLPAAPPVNVYTDQVPGIGKAFYRISVGKP